MLTLCTPFFLSLMLLLCLPTYIKAQALNPAITKTNFAGKIIGITDGDTYKILYNNQAFTLRLAHIDCPEKRGNQPYGTEAKKIASMLCFGKQVNVVHQGFDRNKRIIAEIYLLNNTFINLKMVQLGYAWHFKKYSKSQLFANAEITARNAKVGLWASEVAIAPWDFRKKKKTKNVF